MWGYWGWGGSTRELVEAFDAAEAMRGYEPAVFVDARARRQVRAVGFRGDALSPAAREVPPIDVKLGWRRRQEIGQLELPARRSA
jgi:hypothetical protein